MIFKWTSTNRTTRNVNNFNSFVYAITTILSWIIETNVCIYEYIHNTMIIWLLYGLEFNDNAVLFKVVTSKLALRWSHCRSLQSLYDHGIRLTDFAVEHDSLQHQVSISTKPFSYPLIDQQPIRLTRLWSTKGLFQSTRFMHIQTSKCWLGLLPCHSQDATAN